MSEKRKTVTKSEALEQIKLECFKGVLEQMLLTYKEKNHDYGGSFDKTLDEFGLVAAVVRMADKMNRLEALIKSDEQLVKDESIRDTLQDLANYAVLTLVYTDEATSSDGYLQSVQNKMQKDIDDRELLQPKDIADGMIDEMARQTEKNVLEARLALESTKRKKPEQTKLNLK